MFLSFFDLQWAMIRIVRDLLEFSKSWEVHQKDLVNDSFLHFMVADWWSTLREADAVIASGADASPQLHACRAEALLKLHRLENAELSLSNARKSESSSLGSQSKLFRMLSEVYLLVFQSQLELALGRDELVPVAIIYLNLRDLLKLVRLTGKISGLIFQMQFYNAIEQLAGTNSGSGRNQWVIAIKLSVFSQIILKPFFGRLPQMPRGQIYPQIIIRDMFP
ncbi:hypothetical protein BC332_23921 [Capsicum chinense]|nr:hypothetical protein BC332_23921 [Capsicum chinense]